MAEKQLYKVLGSRGKILEKNVPLDEAKKIKKNYDRATEREAVIKPM